MEKHNNKNLYMVIFRVNLSLLIIVLLFWFVNFLINGVNENGLGVTLYIVAVSIIILTGSTMFSYHLLNKSKSKSD